MQDDLDRTIPAFKTLGSKSVVNPTDDNESGIPRKIVIEKPAMLLSSNAYAKAKFCESRVISDRRSVVFIAGVWSSREMISKK